MQVYLDVVMILNFLVDLLLLLGTNRLTGYPSGLGHCALAAALGGIYGAACLLPEFRFLANMFWRIAFLVMIAAMAFGLSFSAFRRGAVFVLLSMALGGIVSGTGLPDFAAILICVLLVWLLCCVGFGVRLGSESYIPVELNWKGKKLKLQALRDTGNTLQDPLTGEQVLVCGADVGEALFGLGREAFLDPVGTAVSGLIPGCRLIPYRAVGQPSGMLLAVRMKDAKVGTKIVNPLVAFAPHEIAKGREYQMLTGGMV